MLEYAYSGLERFQSDNTNREEYDIHTVVADVVVVVMIVVVVVVVASVKEKLAF